jgi:glucose-1-phosphate thymidylyltransferase
LCTDNVFKLLPITYSLPKELIPVANTPVIEFIKKRLTQAGINNIAIVVGENTGKFENYLQDGRKFDCKIKYYSQPGHLGSAYGLLCAKEFIDDDFILIYGINLKMHQRMI